MSFRSVLAGLAALVFVLTALGPPTLRTRAAAAETASASTTVLRVDGGGRGLLRVPRIRQEPGGLLGGPDSSGFKVSVSGPGIFYGLILMPEGSRPKSDVRSLAVLATDVPGHEFPAFVLGGAKDDFPVQSVLPAGDYVAYLSAHGRVDVTITWPNGGAKVLRQPAKSSHIRGNTLRAELAGVAALPSAALGWTTQAGGRGMFSVSFNWSVMAVSATRESFGCVYPGGALSPAEYSVPGMCSGRGVSLGGVAAYVDNFQIGISWIHLSRGTWGNKNSLVASGVPEQVGITMMTIAG